MSKMTSEGSLWRRILHALRNLFADGGPLAPGWGFGRRKN